MNFPPSRPSHDSVATGRSTPGSSSSRSQQPSRGPHPTHPSNAPPTLTPLVTSIPSSTLSNPGSRRNTAHGRPLDESSRSPVTSSSAGNPTLSDRTSGGNHHTSGSPSSSTSQPSSQAGTQQLDRPRLLSSPWNKIITPSSQAHQVSSAAASTAASQAQGGGGGQSGGGGPLRSATFSPASQSNISSPTGSTFGGNQPGSANTQAGQLSKIVIAQVFLLLSTIKEDKDKTKWDSQADQIRKLISSNGMEVFSKYFRRLVTGNSPQIFPGINKPVENAGNYPLLVSEMQKISQDLEQAHRIAETIDTSDGDIFKDFDLSTFMEHFKLDPIAKTILALAFKAVSRPDLRTKADAILSNNFQYFLQTIANPTAGPGTSSDLTPSFIATIIERLVLYPPRNLADDWKARLAYAVRLHYEVQNVKLPMEVSGALQIMDLLGTPNSLARLLQQVGPQATSTNESARDLLNSINVQDLDPKSVADALLFTVVNLNWQQFKPSLLVSSIMERTRTQGFDWQKVVDAFDREGLQVYTEQFLALYHALVQVKDEQPSFDIQLLWGGVWQNVDTQLSFLTAFCTLTTEQLDASQIPGLRRSFSMGLFEDGTEAVKERASRAVKHPLVSLDAITAIFNIVLQSNESSEKPESQIIFQSVFQPNMDIFLCSALAVPKPWNETQHDVVLRVFFPLLLKNFDGYAFALHAAWKLDKQWVATRLVEAHSQAPMQLPILLDTAVERGWLDELLELLNGFGIDLAALAHRRGLISLDQWATTFLQSGSLDFAFALMRFLTIKAEDEMRTVRKEQAGPRTVSLAVKTVYTLLEILEDHLQDRRDDLTVVQRLCIGAYPRLMNYGEGYDDVIDAAGEESNSISEAADAKMQDYYKQMYSAELDVREMVEILQKYKTSRDAAEQDLFASLVHGLFDEFSCFHTYPLEALATTAVLFGGIINFNLISGIPLRVGLGMILESVREYPPESSMYKFGLQALLHFINRLPEWPGFCHLLIQIPHLQGTEAYARAQEVLNDRATQMNREEEAAGTSRNGLGAGQSMTDGNAEDGFLAETNMQRFLSLHVDPPLRPDIYEEPSEDIQDKVLFALNNVSELNLKEKLNDIKEALQEKHHQWFATYLVEERAKMQPNFHQLYLDLLKHFGRKILWAEVLRETYVSAIRLLNAESTLNSTTERNHLKNLGAWLGSLTIARDKPIKHKNISFKDLLIEGYDTQRLIMVIPFTCKVLLQAQKSLVFKPPNPWLMDIIGLLIELYHFAELKLNMKFEIEVLCKDLELDHTTIEPSTALRERPRADDELATTVMPDGVEGFEDLSLNSIRQSARSERFSPAAISSLLPDLSTLLVYPPTMNGMINPNRLRQIVQTAVQRAILEIISPVVERSVTIASISTSQLIHKDFAMEPNEDRVRQSALTMVKILSGSLALVTCKEPLRMSMTNYIRLMLAELPDHTLPEGAILMCVNDNLDTACSMVEQAAEQRSMPEIEENIEQQLAARRRHRALHPNEPFIDPVINRWAFCIPEPYKQTPGGLNKEQMAIYEEFARQSRGPITSAAVASADGSRQLNDMVQEQYPAVPNLPTPAEPPAVPHQTVQQQQQRLQQPGVLTPGPQHQMNGLLDVNTLRDRVYDLLSELQTAANEAPQEHVKELSAGSPPMESFNRLLVTIAASAHREEAALTAANKICVQLYTQSQSTLEIEILVLLLNKLCQMASVVAKEVIMWLATQDDERVFNVPVTVSLLSVGLLELHRIDQVLTNAFHQRKVSAVEFLLKLLDEVCFGTRPIALRADFASSLEALGQWLADEPDIAPAKELVRKLKDSGIPETAGRIVEQGAKAKEDQIEYIFLEWVGVCSNPMANEKMLAAFVRQLHKREVLHTQEDWATFFRLCIEAGLDHFEHEEANPSSLLGDCFILLDSLAKLIITIVKYQNESEDSASGSKTRAAHLDSILSLVVLVLNQHHVMRGEAFNQRAFFRLFSSILCEYQSSLGQGPAQDKDFMMVFADRFQSLQPAYFPGFVFGWLSLISHRIFLPGMLKIPDESGWEPYAQIMETPFTYIGELLKPADISAVTKHIYRGVLRILLVLHHDFPEFLVENHFRLCNVIPRHCTQFRNLILSAYPSSFPELPDPFTAGLKVDRLEEIRRSPPVAGNIRGPLEQANIRQVIDEALSGGATEEQFNIIVNAIYHPSTKGAGSSEANVDAVLIHSLVLYVGMSAITAVGQRGGPTFITNSPQASLFRQLAKELYPEARYYFISSVANQLRYPNSHTHYFSYALLYLFGTDQADQQESDVRQQIFRVLLERLILHRPHPWGLIITLLELLKNPSYQFWDQPFIKAAPEIERLFGTLFQHINQSER